MIGKSSESPHFHTVLLPASRSVPSSASWSTIKLHEGHKEAAEANNAASLPLNNFNPFKCEELSCVQYIVESHA